MLLQMLQDLSINDVYWEQIYIRDHPFKTSENVHYFWPLPPLLTALQSLTGSVQGQNRDFPVYFFPTGKNLFSLAGIPVMKTGFSLVGKVHREHPVFITGMGLQCSPWPLQFEYWVSRKVRSKYVTLFVEKFHLHLKNLPNMHWKDLTWILRLLREKNIGLKRPKKTYILVKKYPN